MPRVPRLAVVGVLVLSACSHAPLPTIDCARVLGLRLGQSPEQVRELLGEPAEQGPYSVSWDGKRVADYWMQYADWKNREHSWFGSSDEFHLEFFEKRLVVARAYRQGEFAKDYEESLGLFLGSPTYGQHAGPVRYHVGPVFAKIFRCSAEFRLEEARAKFLADNSVAR